MTTSEFPVPKTVGEAEAALLEMKARTEQQIAVYQEILADYRAMLAGIDRLKKEVAKHD